MSNVKRLPVERHDLGELAESIYDLIMEHTDKLTVTEAIGVLEVVKLQLFEEQQ